jgi:hypothetical protein
VKPAIVPWEMVEQRRARGWTVEEAVSTPPGLQRPQDRAGFRPRSDLGDVVAEMRARHRKGRVA